MIDLNRRHLDTVKAILSEFVPGVTVKAFGSRVAGNAKQYSDLDLVLMVDEPLPPLERAHLEEAFRESDLPFRVDLVEWAALSATFRKLISDSNCFIQP